MSTIKDELHVYLPSNASQDTHPENTASNFIVDLPHQLNFEGEMEAALLSMSYKHNWINFKKETRIGYIVSMPSNMSGESSHLQKYRNPIDTMQQLDVLGPDFVGTNKISVSFPFSAFTDYGWQMLSQWKRAKSSPISMVGMTMDQSQVSQLTVSSAAESGHEKQKLEMIPIRGSELPFTSRKKGYIAS